MRETTYRIVLMLFFVLMFAAGGNMQSKTYKYEVEKPRTMLMVDAFEGFTESGNPRYTGIFRDKEFGTRIENSIEPKTYRDFVSSNSAPRDMVVRASLNKVKDPKARPWLGAWAKTFIFFGIVGFVWNLFAVFFCRDPWRFS